MRFTACGSMTHQGRVVRGPQRWVGGPKPSHSLLMPRAGPARACVRVCVCGCARACERVPVGACV